LAAFCPAAPVMWFTGTPRQLPLDSFPAGRGWARVPGVTLHPDGVEVATAEYEVAAEAEVPPKQNSCSGGSSAGAGVEDSYAIMLGNDAGQAS
jgi:hypothetical protein